MKVTAPVNSSVRLCRESRHDRAGIFGGIMDSRANVIVAFPANLQNYFAVRSSNG